MSSLATIEEDIGEYVFLGDQATFSGYFHYVDYWGPQGSFLVKISHNAI